MEEEIHLKEKKELSNWKKMIIYFFIYALLGWILETVYCLITVGTFHKRGFLYGPICPIYGFGAILLLLSLKKVKGNYFTIFLIGMIVFSLFEFFCNQSTMATSISVFLYALILPPHMVKSASCRFLSPDNICLFPYQP